MNEIAVKSEPINLRRQIIWIFLLLFFTYAYFFQGGHINFAPQLCLIRAIIERHTLDVGGYPTGWDIFAFNGRLYSCKAPGNSFMGLIPFYAFYKLLPLLKIPNWLTEHLLVYFTTLFTASLFTALTSIFIYSIIYRITGDTVSALFAGIGYGLATIAFPFATLFYLHSTATFFSFGAFYILFKILTDSPNKPINNWLILLAGVFAGFGFTSSYPNFFIALFLGIYLFWSLTDKLKTLWFVLGGFIGSSALLIHNYLIFGDPFFITYKAYAIAEKTPFTEVKQGFLGVTYPRLEILKKITYDPQRGLFYYNPLLLAMIPGIVMMLWQKRLFKELCLITAIIVFHFLFNAAAGQSIMFWGGGGSAGPRHLHSMIPFAMIPVGLFFSRLKPLFVIFFIPSFLIMLLTTAVQPVLGFEKNPLRDYVLPTYLKNELAIHPYGTFNNTLITQKSVAFNLGMLLGFKGSFSLLPLLGIWLVFLWFILADYVRVQLLPKCSRYLIIISTFLFFLPIIAYPELAPKNQEKINIRPHYYGVIGYYYSNDKWQGNPTFIRYDKVVNFNWKWGSLPLPLPFSIEWKGYLIAPLNATYTLGVETNGEFWLYLDENLIMNKSGESNEPQLTTAECTLTVGRHPLLLRYINRGQNATIKLYWKSGVQMEIIPGGYFIAR